MPNEESQEDKVLKESLLTLASVLHVKKTEEEEEKDPLFLACSLLGKRLDIRFKEPKNSKPYNLMHQLDEIAEISSIRYRQVTLEESWWKEDSGHLLSFLAKDLKPIVLFWENRKYHVVDPDTKKSQIVDKEIANAIVPFAIYFYPPFTAATSAGKDILNFGYANVKRKITLAFFIGMAISLLDLALPFGSKIIFGSAIPQLNRLLLWQVGAGILFAAGASALYQLAQGLLVFHINSIAGNRIECAEWDRILKLPANFFKSYSVGDLWSRIYAFVSIRRTFSNAYITLLFSGGFSIFYLIAMGYFSFYLTLTAVAISALFLIFAVTCMMFVSKYQQQSLEIKGKINGLIVQTIQGIGKIKSAGAEKRVFSRWAKLYAEQKRKDLKGQFYNVAISTAFAAMPSFAYLCIFSLMIYYVYETQNNPANIQVSRGNFFGFVTAFALFSSSIVASVPAITNFYRRVRPLWQRAKAVFQEKAEDDPPKPFAKQLEGQILVDQVSFRYGVKGPLVINNMTIQAQPGEFIGIVGPSGCGKSTLLRLLLGFEKPSQGSIYFDGEDMNRLNLHSIRRQMGVVLQNGSLLAGSIYENLVYGGLYSNDQVERAVRLSGFDQDLEKFPMGLHTMLSSGGGTLSGGQKQRLLIARALISEPKILLFDEATNALDNRTQEIIRKNIEQLNVTRIVIAHRLNTIRHANRIYVMDKGELISQGTFEELQNSPVFAKFIERQKL